MDKEVSNLESVDSNTEIKYPTWLAIVMLVRKASNKWCMCAIFTNLNMVFPEDPYPLPNIDRLIDGSLGYHTLSFLDACLGVQPD